MATSTFPTVKIGFQRVHYKVNEGDGCVQVCAVILSGYLGHQDKISFRFTTASITATGMLYIAGQHTLPNHFAFVCLFVCL